MLKEATKMGDYGHGSIVFDILVFIEYVILEIIL